MSIPIVFKAIRLPTSAANNLFLNEYLMNQRIILIVLGLWSVPMSAWSDEGMWLLNEPPRELLKEKYGFDLTKEWLEHAQLASIRFNNGGSGSFVSGNGLDHHQPPHRLRLDAKTRNRQGNLYRDGFLARKRSEELKCPDLELNVLQEIVDVTKQVNDAVKPGDEPGSSVCRPARRRCPPSRRNRSTRRACAATW